MIENLKTDIIYFNTDTDFELEFNLCGCCRMRLLTEKVNTRNEFAKSLSRAVSRSKIIIACGTLFGEKNLIETVSLITDIGMEALDNTKYGIKSDGEIKILNGSTPLINSNGIFGGCIIEKNLQTIILLTESKSIRKTIMSELIHTYVAEVSVLLANKPESGLHDEPKQEIPHVKQPTEEVSAETTEVDELNEGFNEETELQENLEQAVSEENPIRQIILENQPVENADKRDIITLEETVEKQKEVKTENSKDNTAKDGNIFPLDIEGDDGILQFIDVTNEKRDSSSYYSLEEDISQYSISDEKTKSNGKLKIFIFVLVFVIVGIALALVYLMVVKPMLSGYDIKDYIKKILSPIGIKFISFRFL